MKRPEHSSIGPGGGHAGAWSLGEGPNVSRSEQQRRLSVDARGIWSKLLRVGANLHGDSGTGSAAVVRPQQRDQLAGGGHGLMLCNAMRSTPMGSV
jgi:hypothetical protein